MNLLGLESAWPLFGLSDRDALALALGIAAFLEVLLIWYALLERDPLPGRIKALARRRQALKQELSLRARRSRRPEKSGLARALVTRMRLARGKAANRAQLRLQRAGWRSRDALYIYLTAKVVLPFLALGLACIVFFLWNPFALGTGPTVVLSAMSVLAGAYAPEIVAINQAQRRLQKIRATLPDAFDLMVICAEAGLSLDATFQRVSREMSQGAPELADELALTAVELGLLPERVRALNGLATRAPLPGLSALINTLMQSERYGTPLAQALRVLSAELRHERMMKAEAKAARLPAILTVPMVAFILPPLFLVLLGPAILGVMDALKDF